MVIWGIIRNFAGEILIDDDETEFAFDVTPYAVPGKNRLKVTVCNQDESVAPISADFTFMGGIYRDVWLLRLYRGQGRPDTDGNPTDRRLSALPDDA